MIAKTIAVVKKSVAKHVLLLCCAAGFMNVCARELRDLGSFSQQKMMVLPTLTTSHHGH